MLNAIDLNGLNVISYHAPHKICDKYLATSVWQLHSEPKDIDHQCKKMVIVTDFMNFTAQLGIYQLYIDRSLTDIANNFGDIMLP